MDKQYEPLIQALLTDMNENDVDRIYESLYVSLFLPKVHYLQDIIEIVNWEKNN